MTLPFPDIDPVAFHLGPLPVRWYALAYLAAFLSGWRYVLYLSGMDKGSSIRGRVTAAHIDDFFPWAMLGVILGGRLGYVLFYQFETYAAAPAEIFRIWNGGMSFHGGAAGMIIAMIVFSWKKGLDVLRLTDMICAAVPIGLFFGRIANFINGELYGRVSSASWAMVFPNGGPDPRHPSQIYEAGLEGFVLTIVLAALIHINAVRNRPGVVSAVFLAGYAAFRFFVEFFREPDEQIGFIATWLTMGQILCLPMFMGSAIIICWVFIRERHDTSCANNPEKNRN